MKNNKRIALTLALPLLLSISSCKISPTGNGAQRSEYPGDRELNLSLANEDEKSMKEAYAAFFKKTLECDRMHVYVDLGYQGDDFVYSEEDISGTSSHYTSFVETRTGFFDNYKVSKATEVWAFIDGDGNKIYALSMEQYNDRSFVRGEDYYKGGYKFFLWDMNLIDHPSVSSGDSIAPGHLLQRRIDRPVVCVKVHRTVQIGEHQDGFQTGMGFLRLVYHRQCHSVKPAVAAQIEHIRAFPDQTVHRIFKPLSYLVFVFDLPVPAKGNDHIGKHQPFIQVVCI